MLPQAPRRSYTVNNGTSYSTGMERTVLDKFRHTRFMGAIPWFAVLGGLNLGAYGLSLLMDKEDYVYYFGYKGEGRFSDLARGMIGSNVATNALWTGPALIGLGGYLHRTCGAMTMLKFTPLAIFGVGAFWAAFSPN